MRNKCLQNFVGSKKVSTASFKLSLTELYCQNTKGENLEREREVKTRPLTSGNRHFVQAFKQNQNKRSGQHNHD